MGKGIFSDEHDDANITSEKTHTDLLGFHHHWILVHGAAGERHAVPELGL